MFRIFIETIASECNMSGGVAISVFHTVLEYEYRTEADIAYTALIMIKSATRVTRNVVKLY